MDVMQHLDQWEIFDGTALALEAAIERQLDAYCEGRGSAPDPQLVAAARHWRKAANEELRLIWSALRRAHRGVKLI